MFKKFLANLLSLLGLTVTRSGTGIFGGKKLAVEQRDKFKWIQKIGSGSVGNKEL